MGNTEAGGDAEYLGLFHGLLDGAWELRRCFRRGPRTYLVVVRDRRRGLPSAAGRDIDVLRLVALGQTNAEVAFELGLSESAVRRSVSRVMRRLDCDRRLTMVRLGCAAFQEVRFETPRRVLLVRATVPETLSPRPAPEPITDAERAVLLHVLAGASNRDIATVRTVSERTVANQIASLFRKYGASTREELLRHTLRPTGEEHAGGQLEDGFATVGAGPTFVRRAGRPRMV